MILLLFCVTTAAAQTPADPVPSVSPARPGHRISLLTVGTGDEIYASFGHTGIRVVDSAAGSDIVYNWGTFEFGEDFEIKFMRGKLLYTCAQQSYASFYQTYIREQRGFEEQVLFLPPASEQKLLAAIQNNMKEENRYYKYDFLFDNCSTRPRELLKTAFGPEFKYGNALKGRRHTFRDEINIYLAGLPWERFGINLLLGAKIDRVMSNEDAMFLPDYLRDGLATATLAGKQVTGPAERILPDAPEEKSYVNGPLLLTLVIGCICILGTAVPGFDILGRFMRYLLLIVTGLLGALMLFMWFGTDHESCRDNWNILWCLPTNLILPFIKPHRRSRYATIAMLLLVAALFVHLTGTQALPLGIIWPLLLSLAVSYFMMIRAAYSKPLDGDDHHHHHHHHHDHDHGDDPA